MASCLLRTEGLRGRSSPVAAPSHSQLGGMGVVVVAGDEGAALANLTRGDREILRAALPVGREDAPLPAEALDGKHGIYRMLGGSSTPCCVAQSIPSTTPTSRPASAPSRRGPS